MTTKTKSPKSKTSTLDISSFLTNNASPKKSGKSTIPELTDVADLADKAHNAYREMKDAEAAFKLLEADVLKRTNSEYASHAKKGSFTKSFNLPGSDTPGVQISYSDKFSDLDKSQEEGLREQLGDRYDSFFEESRTLVLKDTATDDETIQELIAKLGEDMFKRVFNITVKLSVKADMDRKQFELPEGLADLCGLKQNKPTLKIIKE